MSFELQPSLSSDLIQLRPLHTTDYDSLFAVASDPLIWEQHPDNRHEEPVFRAFFEESLRSGGALIVLDLQSQKMIGSSRYHVYNETESEVEIGWTFLARSYWGGLYNREVKRLMLEHAFRFVDSVVFLVAPENKRSQAAVEKIGGARYGSRENASGQGSYLYRMKAADFVS